MALGWSSAGNRFYDKKTGWLVTRKRGMASTIARSEYEIAHSNKSSFADFLTKIKKDWQKKIDFSKGVSPGSQSINDIFKKLSRRYKFINLVNRFAYTFDYECTEESVWVIAYYVVSNIDGYFIHNFEFKTRMIPDEVLGYQYYEIPLIDYVIEGINNQYNEDWRYEKFLFWGLTDHAFSAIRTSILAKKRNSTPKKAPNKKIRNLRRRQRNK